MKATNKTQNHKTSKEQVFLKITSTLILILKANLIKSFHKFDSYRGKTRVMWVIAVRGQQKHKCQL
jgi:hypothetical protein